MSYGVATAETSGWASGLRSGISAVASAVFFCCRRPPRKPTAVGDIVTPLLPPHKEGAPLLPSAEPELEAAPGCLRTRQEALRDFGHTLYDRLLTRNGWEENLHDLVDNWHYVLSALTTSAPYLALNLNLGITLYTKLVQDLPKKIDGEPGEAAYWSASLLLGLGTAIIAWTAMRTNVLYDAPAIRGLADKFKQIYEDPEMSARKKVAIGLFLAAYYPTLALIPNVAYYGSANVAIKALDTFLKQNSALSWLTWLPKVLTPANLVYTFVISMVYMAGSIGFFETIKSILIDLAEKIDNAVKRMRRFEVIDDSGHPTGWTPFIQALTLSFSVTCAIALGYSFAKQIQQGAAPENTDFLAQWARILKANVTEMAYFYLLSFISSTSYYGSRGFEYIGAMISQIFDKSDPQAAKDATKAFWRAFAKVALSSTTIIAGTIMGGVGIDQWYIYVAIILFTYCNNGKALFPDEAKAPSLKSNQEAQGSLHLKIIARLLKGDFVGTDELKVAFSEAGIEEKEIWLLSAADMLRIFGKKEAGILLKPTELSPKQWSQVWPLLWDKIHGEVPIAPIPALLSLIKEKGVLDRIDPQLQPALAAFLFKPKGLSHDIWQKLWPHVDKEMHKKDHPVAPTETINKTLQDPVTWKSTIGKKAAKALLKPIEMDQTRWNRLWNQLWPAIMHARPDQNMIQILQSYSITESALPNILRPRTPDYDIEFGFGARAGAAAPKMPTATITAISEIAATGKVHRPISREEFRMAVDEMMGKVMDILHANAGRRPANTATPVIVTAGTSSPTAPFYGRQVTAYGATAYTSRESSL